VSIILHWLSHLQKWNSCCGHNIAPEDEKKMKILKQPIWVLDCSLFSMSIPKSRMTRSSPEWMASPARLFGTDRGKQSNGADDEFQTISHDLSVVALQMN
jgi:hypothetical protein